MEQRKRSATGASHSTPKLPKTPAGVATLMQQASQLSTATLAAAVAQLSAEEQKKLADMLVQLAAAQDELQEQSSRKKKKHAPTLAEKFKCVLDSWVPILSEKERRQAIAIQAPLMPDKIEGLTLPQLAAHYLRLQGFVTSSRGGILVAMIEQGRAVRHMKDSASKEEYVAFLALAGIGASSADNRVRLFYLASTLPQLVYLPTSSEELLQFYS